MAGMEGRKFAGGGGLGGSTEGTIDFRPLCRCKSVDMAQAFGFALQNFRHQADERCGEDDLCPSSLTLVDPRGCKPSPDRLQVICAI